jgi:ATP-dependent Clp protease ATP-binding subunit ClpC
MFERFTDRSRRVVVQAQEESRLLNHSYIGTEHLLLGILREDAGVAAEALAALGVSLDAAREQVAEVVGRGQTAPSGHIPFTPRAKKVLELSLREALSLEHQFIAPEHILLGLITEGHGVAVEVLRSLGAPPEQVRARVLELAPPAGGDPGEFPEPGRPVRRAATPAQLDQLLLARLEVIESRLDAIERQLGLGQPPAAAAPE